MEAQDYNPYEQQLLSVYESCLENGKSDLNEKGLRLLCDKLQLEERSIELIASLLKQSSGEYVISFDKFRNGLLNLLDNTQGSSNNPDSIQIINDSSATIMETRKYNKGTSLTLECQRLKELYIGNSNSDCNINVKNSPVMSILDESIIPQRMLEQIFEKLDVNCDGQINFHEFLSLFQNEKNIEETSIEVSSWDDGCVDDSNCDKSHHIIMYGPDHNSIIERRVVIDLWQMAGVTDATTLLCDLGFTISNINLIELMSIISDELKSLEHELKNGTVTATHVRLLRGALVLYQEEVRSMNTLNDQLTREKDKLKADVVEANESANILAQENDETHVKLEKRWQEEMKQLEFKHGESIKELSIQNNCERETYIATIKSLNEQLQNVQQEEQLLRSKLSDALNENHTLEIDNQSLSEQMSKLKMLNNQLKRQIQILAAEHDEAERNEEKENEQVVTLVDRIKKLQAESSLLRDQNDELTSEIELLRARTNMNKEKSFDVNSNFSDSDESNSADVYKPLDKEVSVLKDAIIDDKMANLSNTVALIIRDLKDIALDKRTSTCSSDCVFKRNLSDIICTLESQILAKIPEKLDKMIENEEEECEERASESLRDFVLNKTEKSRFNNSFSVNNDEITTDLETNTKNKTPSLRDYPPKRDENHLDQSKSIHDNDKTESSIDENSSDVVNHDTDIEAIREDRNNLKSLLKEQEIQYNNEKKQLQEQCTRLESDLELLRVEYNQCEDYWVNKLEEERQLIDQEQKISDEKLGELISKIAEYEEQFSLSEKNRNDGRLSPIEEKFNLEQQYIDLEEEYEQLKKQTQEAIEDRESELTILQQKLNDSIVEKSDKSIQFPNADENKIAKKVLYQSNSMPHYHVVPYELPNLINGPIVNNLSYYGTNQKQFGSGKLNKIAEHSVSDNEILDTTSKTFVRNGTSGSSDGGCSCSCQQVDNYCNTDEMSKIQKTEPQRESQKRAHNINLEYSPLTEQKEFHNKDIIDFRNFHGNCLHSASDGQTTKIDMNFVKGLITKLQIQNQKRKNLQVSLKHQKQETEKALEHTWRHYNEVTSLQELLKDTQNSLQHQNAMNAIFIEKLAKSDLLLKDLYVENAHLKADVQRLGERCHMLTHLSSGSTSV